VGTIYTAPPAHSLTYVVGSPDLDEPLGGGFQAAHAMVTNPTDQHLYLPDGPEIVAPGTYGKIVPLRNTDVARASWTIPPIYGVVQAKPSRGGAAQLTFLNGRIEVSPHPGVASSVVATVSGDNPLGDLVVPLGMGAEVDLARPVGTFWLRLNIASGSLLELKVVGDQSGEIYLDATGIPADQLAGVFGCAITEAMDISLTVSGVAAAMSEATVHLSAQLSPSAIKPAPWQVPNQLPVNGTRVGVGTTHLVVGRQGRVVWPFTGMLAVAGAAAGAAGALHDSSGNLLAEIRADSIGQVPFDLRGSPLAVGDGVDLVVLGGAASVEAALAYSQGF
jgi:hypothetical protein